MASIRVRKDTGQLLLDFRYRGERCREQTLLPDTAANRARLQKLADRIEKAINQGSFIYADFFPDSRRTRSRQVVDASAQLPDDGSARERDERAYPAFADFAELWFIESTPRWRSRHQAAIRDALDKIILPFFGAQPLSRIDRAMLLAFRAEISKRPGRRGQALSGKRINKLMALVKAILNEGCDRHGLTSPGRGIKALKQKRTEVQPFTLPEVELLLARVRKDYRPYLTVRLLTGLRTGEANGLQWDDVDFDKNTIRVERSLSRDGDGDTKNESSKRLIACVPEVRAALLVERARAMEGCPWVFHSDRGNPIDLVNFTNRVWYPLLRNLGLKQRPPYQMRHTAATLMLAAGENPEWVAATLGHSTTEMLFRVYSRFVPNLTRSDGLAFAGLVNGHIGRLPAPSAPAHQPAFDALVALRSLSPEQLATLLAHAKKAPESQGGFS